LSNQNGQIFSFSDLWETNFAYAEFIGNRLIELKRVLSEMGSIFFHCDKNAVHIIRALLDKIFGEDNFQSEIIWFYKRWSNAKKGLLPQHQNILFYSKSQKFKFNKVFTDYSSTTNIDQILQKRQRDNRGKAVYMKDEDGKIVQSDCKKGVPLSDVWEIPYLNPKAKERVGYPTQKPLLLLERIISIASDEGDIVLDPFCGSGTSIIAAEMMNRKAVGIDISEKALELAQSRLANKIKTESELLKKGKYFYNNCYKDIDKFLHNLDYNPIHRNKGIDAILKEKINNKIVFIRIQRQNESINEASQALNRAISSKGGAIPIVISTNSFNNNLLKDNVDSYVVNSTQHSISKLLHEFRHTKKTQANI